MVRKISGLSFPNLKRSIGIFIFGTWLIFYLSDNRDTALSKSLSKPFSFASSSPKCSKTLVLIVCQPEYQTNQSDSSMNVKTQIKKPSIDHKFERQIEQTITNLKSIMITSVFGPGEDCSDCINVIVVANSRSAYEDLQNRIEVEKFDRTFTRLLNISFVEAKYPKGSEWMKGAYRTCATLRFFLPDLLPDSNLVAYVDTDFIFLRSFSGLWDEFSKFGSSAVAGLVSPPWTDLNPITDNLGFKYDPQRQNAGLMLMNLTRMRETNWVGRIEQVAARYLPGSDFADQDILVIYFLKHPQELFNVSCTWNLARRPSDVDKICTGGNSMSTLHGTSAGFYTSAFFKAVFKGFQAVKLTKHFSIESLQKSVQLQLDEASQHPHPYEVLRRPYFGQWVMRTLAELKQSCYSPI